ncbi:glr1222 [Gloeobacter violaceus PCC 7421]|uniref:Glr1222 protein n=2 Tax=Gloeobacter violaceus TaxID=33072 RepID=Q7NLA4_GLOVI|nr:glr1222 [Gloeobacter violaceus PCC 7421]
MTPDAGQVVYEKIYPQLQAGRQVELDFDRVEIFASPFFNYAVGQLLGSIKPEALDRLLIVQNLGAAGKTALARVLENARQYYSDEHVREAHDRVLSEQAATV